MYKERKKKKYEYILKSKAIVVIMFLITAWITGISEFFIISQNVSIRIIYYNMFMYEIMRNV